MRHLLALLVLPTLLLAACGGGSSGPSSASTNGTATASNGSSSSSASSSTSSSSAISSSGSSSSSAAPVNTVAITVDGGPAALQAANTLALNIPYVSVTICAPGTSQCQTIDHVSVDTGSSGFRVISSVLSPSLLAALPAQTNTGLPVQECLEFADGYVFGPVVTADLKIGAETAASVPVQVMGGSSFAVPQDCVSGAMGQPEEDTVVSFGANGVLGVSSFIQDCGQACAQSAVQQGYYTCSTSGGSTGRNSGSCTSTVEPLAQQVSNPVASFPTDNNGVVLQLPAVGENGASNVSGTLIFGIGTQSNNTPGSSVVVLTEDGGGNISTSFNGQTYNESFIDSGSNGYFFTDSSIPQCPSTGNAIAPGFFCPPSSVSLTATNTGNTPSGDSTSSPSSTVNFTIGNAVQLLEGTSTVTALSNLGGALPGSALSSSFDLGLPFFFGRTIYFALEGANTPQGAGPYYAY